MEFAKVLDPFYRLLLKFQLYKNIVKPTKSPYMTYVSVSILNINFMELEKELSDLKRIGVKYIHIDVIDTSFADNISFGPEIINRILERDFIFQIHVMIANPVTILAKINLERVESVVVHSDYEEVRKLTAVHSVKMGCAINPKDPVKDTGADFYLIMTVNPGFGGQKIIPGCIEKIEQAKALNMRVSADGGINKENIHLFRSAEMVVVGSALINAKNRREYFEELNKILN